MLLVKGMGLPPMPLTMASDGSVCSVDRLSGADELRLRLSELGLVNGAEIEVMNRSRQGMLVVKVGGSRLALSSSMAEKVWVKS